MRRSAFFLLLTALLANGQELLWENTFDDRLDFTCPPGQSISYVKSEHDNHANDRIWEFGCKDTFDSASDCFLSSYVNDYDLHLKFECPAHYIITGMSSIHDNHHNDRRWQFHCCRSNSVCTTHCEWTTYVNYFDEAFHWTVPNLNYLVGAESYHSNGPEDRRWMYQYCSKVQC